MLRRSIVPVALFIILAGCQDYNFNPVGKCVIQPGSQRVQLAKVSTADVLFVVDDSASMDPLQDNLARNFDAFITALAQKQADRKNQGLDPFEFHIAITTSSVFENLAVPPACDGQFCRIPARAGHAAYSYACTQNGAACGDYVTSFYDLGVGCTAGVATAGATYPQGDFVALGAKPKVLHFTKDLKWETWGTGSVDPQLQAAVDDFKANVKVGSCGSGQEQHFESARLAVKKALQLEGLKQAAGVGASEWPHAGAKMVVVWLGNEDDCSNPQTGRPEPSGAGGGSLILSGGPGSDTCVSSEASTPATDTVGQLFPLDDYVNFFSGLGRPFGAAFIYSALPNGSGGFAAGLCPSGCTVSTSSPPPANACTGDSPGTRFQSLASALRQKGLGTVEGTVCDAEFASTLQSIADLVTPVNALSLPTAPATSDVAVLRIETADGATRKFCNGPGADLDWNFVSCDGKATPAPAGTTTACITINHATKNCEANPGESYVAQYLGSVPAGGCTKAAGELATESQDCADKLGGTKAAWQCFGAVAGGTIHGTCVCQSDSTN